MNVAYICDRKKCESCWKGCRHTQDIHHAANFYDLAKGADKFFEKERPAQSGPGWIPVTERLPEKPEPVIVTVKWNKYYKEVSVGEYWGSPDEWGSYGELVTAWMPLPDPYDK